MRFEADNTFAKQPANAKRRAKAFVQVPATHAVTSA